ncbi:HlyU family transcriptional regulator [Oryzibacter oryziterrae]|uniref:HlyU family transcriptional regulator n=1 Tax=Oryzibacter oryziterrae TaxID=2766474 RepID=UPI001F19D198|nr:HlyU family transcriptional regulator [Oryzibacter oryziterrae]
MSFWKKLFGGGNSGATLSATAPTQEHKGFIITSTPFKADGGQWQLCGVISLETPEGGKQEHRFVRADKFTDVDQAHDIVFQKGRLIIDQQGKSIFS